MQALTELLPPTAVTHAVQLPFLDSRAQNLIVAKSSLLQIYKTTTFPSSSRVVENGRSPTQHTASDQEGSASQYYTRLVLIAEYPLSGIITSLVSIKTSNSKSGGEALLISFKDAKLSLVEWDPETYGLSTISIHYYENDELQGSSWAPDLQQCSNFLTADPSSRCAALKFGIRHLAVLPFRQSGDDLTMDDYDPELDEAPQPHKSTAATNGFSEVKQTPYGSSFVLPLTALDPNLLHPIDLAFLYEYREPTLGVLSSSKSPSTSLSQDRKDVLTYTAFTLDLEQRARTLLLSVSGLPSDLFKLTPLPLPVGGTLLIGGNEVVHVDQSGKTNAVAVNEFARQASAFPMTDQSDLCLKLEGSVIELLNANNGDMLLILSTGKLVIISFRVDGRSVSGLSLKPVLPNRGGNLNICAASCAVALTHDTVFIGSEDADSVLVRYSRQRPQLSRKRSHADMLGLEEGVSDEEAEDEDDLYAEETPVQRPRESSTSTGIADDGSFQIDDRLPNIGTAGDPCFAHSTLATSHSTNTAVSQTLESLPIALATGREGSGGLALLSRQIEFSSLHELPLFNVARVWSLSPQGRRKSIAENGRVLNSSSREDFDRLIITSTDSEEDATSKIYEWSPGGLEERTGTDFLSDTSTLDSGVLCGGKRIVQISRSEVRCLDEDLALTQIVPMLDEATDNELQITHTSFTDQYLLLLRNDSSAIVLKADSKGDQLEELEAGEVISAGKWTAGCLYDPETPGSNPMAFLLSIDGALHIFDLPDLQRPAFVAEGTNLMPSFLTVDNLKRRSPNRETIVELLVADLGDAVSRSPFLILRTARDGLALYSPYHFPSEDNGASFTKNLRWLKISDTSLVKLQQGDDSASDTENDSLKYVPNLGGYGAVIVPGKPPSLILKDAIGMPNIFQVRDHGIRNLSDIHVADCTHGLLATRTEGNAMSMQLPLDTRFCYVDWVVRRMHLGQQVDSICYHAPSDLYIVGTNEQTVFSLPDDDDWHQEWGKEDLTFKPTGSLAKVQLFDSKSWSVIGEIVLEQDEIITSAKTLDLEVSEFSHERKPLVAVSTVILKGEDLPSNGGIYIFDVVDVVPEPARPETNRNLKQLVREEVKGAVTGLSAIGTEGFLLAAQGQKCMVRGLKEDDSLLPVAFLDLQCQVTAVRNLEGTGLALVGDAIKGVWLFGYSIGPYRMRVFAKTVSPMEVVAAEFLPWEKKLFILSADSDCNVSVLEFNPEDPKSLSGQRLLNRSIFHTGYFATSLTLIPYLSSSQTQTNSSEDVDMDDNEQSSPAKSILMTTQSGALALITPLPEESYRRLGALQAHLNGILEHACGLNPRAYRAVESEGFGSRGILDGQILKRWYLLSTQRKSEACARVGSDVWEINLDLRMISGLGQR